jgi:hypothetical protein
MTNDYLINELIQAGMDKELKELQESLIKWLPIELINIEDRMAYEKIDEYFKSKAQLR